MVKLSPYIKLTHEYQIQQPDGEWHVFRGTGNPDGEHTTHRFRLAFNAGLFPMTLDELAGRISGDQRLSRWELV